MAGNNYNQVVLDNGNEGCGSEADDKVEGKALSWKVQPQVAKTDGVSLPEVAAWRWIFERRAVVILMRRLNITRSCHV